MKQLTRSYTPFLHFITFVLVYLIAVQLSAQPNTWATPFSVSEGQKPGQYASSANKASKRGNYISAASNAARGLLITQRKGQLKKFQEILRIAYPMAVKTHENRIEKLKNSSSNFENDQTVTQRSQVVALYKELINLNDVMEIIPNKKFKSKRGEDLQFDFKDYRPDLQQAEILFEIGKEDAAEMHYQRGLELKQREDIESNKSAAKAFRMAQRYMPDYKNSKVFYEETRKLGTTRMGVLYFTNKSNTNIYGDVGSLVTNEIIDIIFNNPGKYNFEFFELINRAELDRIIEEQRLSVTGVLDEESSVEVGKIAGVQVLLLGEINSISADRTSTRPKTEAVEREVVIRKEKYKDSEGKERVREIKGIVKASYTRYSKQASAGVRGAFKILDAERGNYIKTGSHNATERFNSEWGSFRGDKRALSSRQRRLVNRDEDPYPSKGAMVNRAAEQLARKLADEILTYARTVGL